MAGERELRDGGLGIARAVYSSAPLPRRGREVGGEGEPAHLEAINWLRTAAFTPMQGTRPFRTSLG